jgi:hypothetical protein
MGKWPASQQASLKHYHLPIDAADVFEEIIQQIDLQYQIPDLRKYAFE